MNGKNHSTSSRARGPKALLPLALFICTVLTTVAAGALFEGADIFSDPALMLAGVPFSSSLLLILGTHELGHFFAAKRHNVVTTFPLFIPGPPIPPMIGTFGAVIRIKSPITTKNALVEIGASGPLAGFIVALAVTSWGLDHSAIIEKSSVTGALGLGSSLIFEALTYLTFGPLKEGLDVSLHPVAFAGWIGMFVTAMNLLPIGQLDGGHIAYALLGRRQRPFSAVVISILVALGVFAWPGWFIWAALISILGLWHPPIENERESLDWKRRVIAIAALAVFILTFMPAPFYI